MKEKLLSIIVPIYNSEQYLEKCIQSILDQIYKNIEIILIDDGSTDASLKICKAFEVKDCRIRIISRTNQGIIATRKEGISVASGEWIGFVDSDDWVDSDMYSTMMDYVVKYDVDLVTSGLIWNYQDGKMDKCTFDGFEDGLYTDLDKEIFPYFLYNFKTQKMGFEASVTCKIFKKEILKKAYNGLDEKIRYGEDAVVYPYILQCNKLYVCNRAFYHYNIHSESICRSEIMCENNELLYKFLEKHFIKYKDKYKVLKQLRWYIFNLEIYRIKINYGISLKSQSKWEFHFDQNLYNSRVILYGAGECGQAIYYEFVRKNKQDNVVLWVDSFPEGKSDLCLHKVYGSEKIVQKREYDYVIVAIEDQMIAKNIRKMLISEYMVKPEKIVWNNYDVVPILNNIIF